MKTLLGVGNVHLALLVCRLWLGAMMLYHGSLKLFGGMERFLETVTSKLHLPAALGWLAAGAEFIGGALVAIGLLTRPAAIGIACTMAVAAFCAHAANPWAQKEFALSYFVFALALIIAGAGQFSVDALITARISDVELSERVE